MRSVVGHSAGVGVGVALLDTDVVVGECGTQVGEALPEDTPVVAAPARETGETGETAYQARTAGTGSSGTVTVNVSMVEQEYMGAHARRQSRIA